MIVLTTTSRVLFVLAVLLAACSCRHPAEIKSERIALLPVNVLLGPGSDSDWLRAAVPLILERDLAADPDVYLFAAADSSAAYAGRATQELQVTMNGENKRHLHVDLRDLSTQQANSFDEDSSASMIVSFDELAKRISPHAMAFPVQAEPLLQVYAGALANSRPQERIADLKSVTAASPNFGLAYLSLIEAEVQAGLPDLPETLARAKAHENKFDPYDRARLDLVLTRFTHTALSTLADQADTVLKLAPHDLEALAALGEARFLQGNAQAGQRALSTAIELSPADSRLRDQLAKGFLETRDFARAELVWKELGSAGSSASHAVAVLLGGDRSRASTLLDSGLQANPLTAIIRAQWAAIGGADVSQGPQRGLGLLESSALSNGDSAALAAMQSSLWWLQLANQKGAQSSAASALHLSQSLTVKQTAQVIALIVNAGSASVLQSRIEAVHGDRATKEIVLGYGLFLYGDYNAAAEQWRDLIASSGDTDLRSRAMLASSLHRSGKDGAAFGIVVEPFVPNLSGTDPFTTIAFNEMRQLLKL